MRRSKKRFRESVCRVLPVPQAVFAKGVHFRQLKPL